MRTSDSKKGKYKSRLETKKQKKTKNGLQELKREYVSNTTIFVSNCDSLNGSK